MSFLFTFFSIFCPKNILFTYFFFLYLSGYLLFIYLFIYFVKDFHSGIVILAPIFFAGKGSAFLYDAVICSSLNPRSIGVFENTS